MSYIVRDGIGTLSGFAILAVSIFVSINATGHTFRSAVLTIDRSTNEQVALQWVGTSAVLPVLPRTCIVDVKASEVIDGRAAFLCADATQTTITFPETTPRPEVLVIDRRTEPERHIALPPGTRSWSLSNEVLAAVPGGGGFFRHGMRHLASGADHVAMVISLVLLIGSRRKLAFAIVGFTCGHALGLAIALSNTLTLSASLIDALIALSVFAMAVELVADRGDDAWICRWPISVSLGFGTIHGLGFAAALGGSGLPTESWVKAVVYFHLGLEAAQIAMAGATLIALSVFKRWSPSLNYRVPTAYVFGSLGVFWICQIFIAHR
jgi:hypothetical protein